AGHPNHVGLSPEKLAEGSHPRILPRMRPHPDAERPTKELDAEMMASLVRATSGDRRRTLRIEAEQLRALGIEPSPASSASSGPKPALIIIERYRKLGRGKHSTRSPISAYKR
ncbi:MAG: hypothetical protein JWO36_5670, partial [Myxococcales bacterium]|nr:hypothetical protein [Myxococcales bacterium]